MVSAYKPVAVLSLRPRRKPRLAVAAARFNRSDARSSAARKSPSAAFSQNSAVRRASTSNIAPSAGDSRKRWIVVSPAMGSLSTRIQRRRQLVFDDPYELSGSCRFPLLLVMTVVLHRALVHSQVLRRFPRRNIIWNSMMHIRFQLRGRRRSKGGQTPRLAALRCLSFLAVCLAGRLAIAQEFTPDPAHWRPVHYYDLQFPIGEAEHYASIWADRLDANDKAYANKGDTKFAVGHA